MLALKANFFGGAIEDITFESSKEELERKSGYGSYYGVDALKEIDRKIVK